MNPEELEAFIRDFWGYGNPEGALWFVGPEQGGDAKEVSTRVATWIARGRRSHEDLAEYHRAIDEGHWVDGPKPRLQTTWKQLARMALNAAGRSGDNESVRSYQANVLGRSQSQTLCIELSALPVRNTQAWPYGDYAGYVEFLSSRFTYSCAVFTQRIARIRAMIDEHRPQAVICYGTSYPYDDFWKQITSDGWSAVREPLKKTKLAVGRRGSTLVMMVSHPASWHANNEFFAIAGSEVAKQLASQKVRW